MCTHEISELNIPNLGFRSGGQGSWPPTSDLRHATYTNQSRAEDQSYSSKTSIAKEKKRKIRLTEITAQDCTPALFSLVLAGLRRQWTSTNPFRLINLAHTDCHQLSRWKCLQQMLRIMWNLRRQTTLMPCCPANLHDHDGLKHSGHYRISNVPVPSPRPLELRIAQKASHLFEKNAAQSRSGKRNSVSHPT